MEDALAGTAEFAALLVDIAQELSTERLRPTKYEMGFEQFKEFPIPDGFSNR